MTSILIPNPRYIAIYRKVMMESIEKPKLRNINAFPVQISGKQMICIQDPLRFSEKTVVVPREVFFIISLFNGDNSKLDIQEQYTRRFGDILFSEQIQEIIEQLDANLLLDSDHFEQHKAQVLDEFRSSSIREAFHITEDASNIREQLTAFFTSPEGPGQLAADDLSPKNIRGIVSPHIDLARGGSCYAWAYKEIAEKCDANLFVILGTSHSMSENQFILTAKDFQTPLGIMPTDKDFVNYLASGYSSDLFEDELIHRFEHSIEFQVIFLQYVLRGRKDVKIVPVLCSSFHEMIENDVLPSETPSISDFIALMKDTVAQSGKSVCFIAGADLAHIGQRFGDQVQISPALLEAIRSRDIEMLKHVEQLDKEEFYRSIQQERDDRKICGLPPIYMLLSVMEASEGKILKYSQASERQTESVVSFTSMSFLGT